MSISTIKLGVCSGYFNPIHKSHFTYLIQARMRCNYLFVIVNNDNQVKLKGTVPFFDQDFRVQLINNLKFVTQALLSIDNDLSVCTSLRLAYNIAKSMNTPFEMLFFNDGDVSQVCREEQVCRDLGIKTVYLGNKKMDSSSDIIKKAIQYHNDNLRSSSET